MTQADLAYLLSEAAEKLTGEVRIFDAAWVRKLERGEISLTPELVTIIGKALSATTNENALLLEAAGYPGLPSALLETLGISPGNEVSLFIRRSLEDSNSGEVDPGELEKVVSMFYRAVIKEMRRVLDELEKKDSAVSE
jgi:hypothetical protein